MIGLDNTQRLCHEGPWRGVAASSSPRWTSGAGSTSTGQAAREPGTDRDGETRLSSERGS